MKKVLMRNILLVTLTIALAVFFVGCGSGNDSAVATEAVAYPEAPAMYDAEMTGESVEEYDMAASDEAGYVANTAGGAQSTAPTAPQNRKIIYTSNIDVESENFDETINSLNTNLTQANGYISSTYTEQYSYDETRYASYTLRIPADNYRQFVQTVNDIGNVTMFDEYTEDVTLQYVDIESRLKSLRVQEQNLLDMLAESVDVETSILIYDTLAQVQYEIESYTAQQRTLDDLIDYCTVNMYIYEVKVYTPVNESYLSQVLSAIQGSANNFIYGLGDFVIDFIYALPSLIVLAIIAIVIFIIVKKSIKKRRQKQNDAMNMQNPYQNNKVVYVPHDGRMPQQEQVGANVSSEVSEQEKNENNK